LIYLSTNKLALNQAQTIQLYQPTLQAIAMRMLRSKADAEDVVQETFIKWLNAEHEKIKNTKAYLIAAVTNNCINHLKAIQKKKEQYLENFHWPEFVEKIRDTDFSNIDFEGQVNKALQIIHEKLEPVERAALLLREVFDFDYQAIQEVLDKKQEHCRQLICRAKKKLNDETANLSSVIGPKKAAFIEYFDKACDEFHAGQLIAFLRQDAAKAASKKSE
jgi:RNA polymerase sigma factor (sigma-70 family)